MDLKERYDLNIEPARHPWELARLRVVWDLLRARGLGDARPPGDVLDVGSGDGFVASALAARSPCRGYHAVDLRYDAETVASLQSGTILANLTFHRSMSTLPHSGAGFRYVLFLDVLEHVEQDAALLADVAETHAARGAVFLITVPAFPSLYGSHDRHLGHLRRYARARLRGLCMHAGLLVQESGYFFGGPLVMRLADVLLGRMGVRLDRWRGGIGRWKRGFLLTGIAELILVCDYRVARLLRRVGIQLPGLTCYALCLKP